MTHHQAIIFDMDGLLVDTEPVWEEAETATLSAYNVVVEPAVRSRLIGLRNDEFLGSIREIYNIKASLQTLHDEVLERMMDLIPRKAKPMPGVSEILTYVAELDLPTAIASSSPKVVIEAVVTTHGWEEFLPVRCSAEHLPKGKPAPDVYLEAAKALNISPTVCLALEDSPNGARAAIAAGMTCFAVPDRSHTHLEAFQGVTDHVFDSLHAVLHHLKNGG